MKRLFLGVLSVAFAAGLFSLSVPAESATLRIGAHRSMWGSYEIVADRKGYWKKLGLKYKIGHFKQGKLMRNAIIQDNLDTGTTGFSPFTTAISKGAKVTAVGVTASICGAISIVVPVNSKAKSLRDLKGTVFANKKGTSTDFAFQSYIVPSFGLKGSDFPLLSVRATERIAALQAGSAAAAMVGEPQGEIAVRKGLVKTLYPNICKYDNTRMMHVANPSTLKKYPQLYLKYFKGWLRAHKLLKENPEEYARVYTKSLQEVGDKAEYSTILTVLKKLKSQPFITPEVKTYLNNMADKQIKLGWIKKHPDFRRIKFINDSILREAAKEVGYN